MTPERWAQVESVFVEALEHSPETRSEFLDQACAADSELRVEVESLLGSHQEADRMLESPAFIFAKSVLKTDFSGPIGVGSRVGAYRLERKVDEGGMGAVYLAFRADDQFKQKVAIKLIRYGFDTNDVRRRFRHERQILANLVHPHIARLLDGGTAEDGRPYFVMEYVEGVSITKYCREHKLSFSDRLNLFRTVCGAVHYAHQNLVIHRDIKPGNVLVDDQGKPKLLDFGIAKLLADDPELDQTVTMLGAMTPDYASPEQVRRQQVTTVSDVYSLGVLLYELLTGDRPYRLKGRSPEEVARIVCDEEPDRPSTVIARSGTGEVPADTPPESVAKTLKGDLDTIVMMALRKDPSRRYASAEQLSEDIRRYQQGLPVLAAPDSYRYRINKFVSRHRLGVTAVLLVVMILLGSAVFASWQARIAASQRDKANLEEAKARRITKFIQETLGAPNPNQEGRDVKVVEVLDKAAQRAQTELADQPEVLAEVQRTIGYTYYNLEAYDKGEPLLRSALATFRSTLGAEHQTTAEAMKQLGEVMAYQEKYDEAIPLLTEAVAVLERFQSTNKRNFINAKYSLAQAFYFKGDEKQAERLYRDVLDYAQKNLGENDPVVADVSHELANLIRDTDYDGAIQLYQRAIRVIRTLPNAKVNLATGLSNLGNVFVNAGRVDEGEAALKESVAMRAELFGEHNHATAIVISNLSRVSYARGDFAKAEAEARRAVIDMEAGLPKGHRNLGPAYTILGRSLLRAGKLVEAERYLRDGLAIQTKRFGANDRGAAIAESALGECLWEQRRYAEARPLIQHSHQILISQLKETDPAVKEAQARLELLKSSAPLR
jgi:serine/threonine protein kinase/Flp pilus assembly protein TadD